jgi:hypothetical protein
MRDKRQEAVKTPWGAKFAIGYQIKRSFPLQPLRGTTSTATSMVCLLPPSRTPLMGLTSS